MDDNHKFLAAFFLPFKAPLLGETEERCASDKKKSFHTLRLSLLVSRQLRWGLLVIRWKERERGGSITVHQRITLSNIRLSPRFSRPFSRREKISAERDFFAHPRLSVRKRESRASDKMWEGQCIMPRNGGRGRKGGRSSEYEKKEWRESFHLRCFLYLGTGKTGR